MLRRKGRRLRSLGPQDLWVGGTGPHLEVAPAPARLPRLSMLRAASPRPSGGISGHKLHAGGDSPAHGGGPGHAA